MARQVSVELVDDLDDGPAVEAVRFALDGSAYEIDLSAEHAVQLREAVAPFVAAARWVGGARSARRRGQPRVGRLPAPAPAADPDRALLVEMREWGRANGFPVSDRGRISREVQDAFRATPAEVRAEQAATFAALAEMARQQPTFAEEPTAVSASATAASAPTAAPAGATRRRRSGRKPAVKETAEKKAAANTTPAQRVARARSQHHVVPTFQRPGVPRPHQT